MMPLLIAGLLCCQDVVTLLKRGTARLEAGDMKGALEHFDRAVDRNPDDAFARFCRGRARGMNGSSLFDREDAEAALRAFEGSLEDLNRCVDLEPGNVIYRSSRGVTHVAVAGVHAFQERFDEAFKRWDLAVADFSRGIDIGDEEGAARAGRGGTRMEMAETLVILGRRAEALERLDQAIEDASSVIELAPEEVRLRLSRAGCLRQKAEVLLVLGRGQEAGKILDELARFYASQKESLPKNAGVSHDSGLARQSRGEFAEALEDHRRALELQPDNGHVHAHVAQCLLHLGRTDDAIAAAERAVELAPVTSLGLYMRGIARLEKGQKEEGIRDLEAYVKRSHARHHVPDARDRLKKLGVKPK